MIASQPIAAGMGYADNPQIMANIGGWKEEVRKRLSAYLEAHPGVSHAEVGRAVGIENRQRISSFLSTGSLGADAVRAIERWLDEQSPLPEPDSDPIVREIRDAFRLMNTVLDSTEVALTARLALISSHLDVLRRRIAEGRTADTGRAPVEGRRP